MDVDDANAIVNTLKKTSKATAAMYKFDDTIELLKDIILWLMQLEKSLRILIYDI